MFPISSPFLNKKPDFYFYLILFFQSILFFLSFFITCFVSLFLLPFWMFFPPEKYKKCKTPRNVCLPLFFSKYIFFELSLRKKYCFSLFLFALVSKNEGLFASFSHFFIELVFLFGTHVFSCSTWSSCKKREDAFSHRQYGNEDKGKKSHLDHNIWPKERYDDIYICNDNEAWATWDHYPIHARIYEDCYDVP